MGSIPITRSNIALPTAHSPALNIVLNGENREIQPGQSLSELLINLGLGERRLAVELNNSIVPRGEHSTTILNDGDRVEIVHAIGGG